MSWMERITVIYSIQDLPFDEEGSLISIEPESVRVCIPGFVRPVDVGSWCYLKRRRKNRDYKDPDGTLNLVKVDSFRASRRLFIVRYLDYLSHHILIGKSSNSLKTSVGQFQRFVGWCDKNYPQGFDSKENYVKAVEVFSEYTIDLIRKSQININTGAALQLVIFTVGKYIYSDPYGDLFVGLRKISRSLSAVNFSESPGKSQAKSALLMYSRVFHQLTNFVVGFESFPKRLDFEHGYYWFFPTKMPFAGPTNVDVKTNYGKNYKAYDYVNGRIKTVREVAAQSDCQAATASVSRAKVRIFRANEDKYDAYRLSAATMASQAFMMLFSASTGMNLGQMVSLGWDGVYDTCHDRQGFKSIKYRSKGKVVEFYLESKFLPVFKKYLKLRCYLLEAIGVDSYKLLFFMLNSEGASPVGMNLSTDFHRRLKICFDYRNKVTTRMWRAHKSNWLLKNTDIVTASMILQNSPGTVIKHYSEGNEAEAREEMSKFFSKLKRDVVVSKEIASTSISIGQCVGEFSPVPERGAFVVPDCKTPEGCLFCVNYRVHSDAEDYRKLLSLKYILDQTRHLAKDETHFSSLVIPLKDRVNQIALQIKESGEISEDEMIEINRTVNEGESLSFYWSRKLKILDELEVGIWQ